MTTPRLLALSDLHVAHPQNREIVAGMTPGNDDDWLLLAGDVGELYPDIEWALRTLADKYATVVWTPGNHELWTRRQDPVDLRGEQRYLPWSSSAEPSASSPRRTRTRCGAARAVRSRSRRCSCSTTTPSARTGR